MGRGAKSFKLKNIEGAGYNPVMGKGKVFLVYSNTGAGHRTAAEAIKRAILELCSQRKCEAPEIVSRDIIEESNSINRLFTHMYNRLLKDHQDWMKYYFDLIEWVKPNESEIGYRLSQNYTSSLLLDVQPTVIVSVHPMVNHFLARTLKDLRLDKKVKLITVLTDPNANLWTGWACPDADLTIAPNDLAYEKLIELGMKPDAIRVIGMPILPEFIKPPTESRVELLTRIGLDPDELTVAISAGSAGGGNMPKIYKALQQVKKPVQVIFVCGKNAKLKAKMLKEATKSPLRTKVLGYANSVADGMNACDLLVTKAGGLTTFEAIARRLPMAIDMIKPPMPQEAGTVELLIKTGLAQPLKQPDDIVKIVNKLEVVRDRLSKPLPTVHNLDNIDAVYEIAEIVLEYCERSRMLPDELQSPKTI